MGLALLWLIGIRPNGDWFGGATDTLGIFVGGAIFFVLVLVVVWAGRVILGDRIVAQVTTAGTTIALGDKPATYFDEFLDEIVAFFDAVEPKYVIFEDLDVLPTDVVDAVDGCSASDAGVGSMVIVVVQPGVVAGGSLLV